MKDNFENHTKRNSCTTIIFKNWNFKSKCEIRLTVCWIFFTERWGNCKKKIGALTAEAVRIINPTQFKLNYNHVMGPTNIDNYSQQSSLSTDRKFTCFINVFFTSTRSAPNQDIMYTEKCIQFLLKRLRALLIPIIEKHFEKCHVAMKSH